MQITVAAAVEQSKAEILADIEMGILPQTVKTFSELHDFVDANTYGGLCDEHCLYSYEEANLIQDFVNAWLVGGRK